MEKPILSVVNAHKHFGGVAAVSDLSFEVQTGEVIGLMGPNGAGKTTLLNIIAGEYKPDSGKIIFKDHDITGLAPHQICKLGIARAFQIPQPFTQLTALENVVVSAIYGQGLSKSAAKSEAERILDFVGLLDRKDILTKNLLVLTLKRLELARVLATKPELVLLDEVAAGLTEEEIPAFLDLLKKVREMGITIILIEHVIKVMVEAVDRIVVMDKGTKIAEGKTSDIMVNRSVIEAYLGE